MEWACLYMMPGGMILFVTLEGCWNMDLTNIEFINDNNSVAYFFLLLIFVVD